MILTHLIAFRRQREALRKAVEAFHEEKAAHIEQYEKQQKVSNLYLILAVVRFQTFVGLSNLI